MNSSKVKSKKKAFRRS